MEASVIIDPVRRTLHDPDAVRWSDLTLLGYLFDAQVEVIRLSPGAYAVREVLALEEGETRHGIVDGDTMRILGVERNMASMLGPPGPEIIRTNYDALVKINRAHVKSSRATVITNYAVRKEDPLRFYTSPPAQKDTFVELFLNKLPSILATGEDTINVNPAFKLILQLFVQGWALMEDTPGGDGPRGDTFVGQAYGALGYGENVGQGRPQDAKG